MRATTSHATDGGFFSPARDSDTTTNSTKPRQLLEHALGELRESFGTFASKGRAVTTPLTSQGGGGKRHGKDACPAVFEGGSGNGSAP